MLLLLRLPFAVNSLLQTASHNCNLTAVLTAIDFLLSLQLSLWPGHTIYVLRYFATIFEALHMLSRVIGLLLDPFEANNKRLKTKTWQLVYSKLLTSLAITVIDSACVCVCLYICVCGTLTCRLAFP